MKYREKIIKYFEELPPGSVVSANQLYEREFSKMTEAAFFKAMERLVKGGVLERVGKGLYAAGDALNTDSRNTEVMLNYFFGENNDNGMYIGQNLYVKYGLTDVTSNEIMLYSNIITKDTCNVGNIHVKRVDVELTYENTKIIEALEIMQNFDNIEGLNKSRFARFAKQFSKIYNDEAAVYVITHMKYKKSTIAFMKKVLDMYKVSHSLQQFLSYSSRYKVPPVPRAAR